MENSDVLREVEEMSKNGTWVWKDYKNSTGDEIKTNVKGPYTNDTIRKT